MERTVNRGLDPAIHGSDSPEPRGQVNERSSLAEQFTHSRGGHQLARLLEVVQYDRVRINAE